MGSYKTYDPTCFKTEVAQLPLHAIYSIHDVNSKLDLFIELSLNTLNRQAPMKCVKIKGRPHKFIHKEIKELMMPDPHGFQTHKANFIVIS